MPIMKQIDEDLIAAMKLKDANKVSVLRMIKAAFTNYKIEKKKETLDDTDAVSILQKQAKQRKESLTSFEQAGRQDLAGKEKAELLILESYIPKQMSDQEIREVVDRIIQQTQVKSKADAGRVMKELMPFVKGKADGKRVNEIVLESLA